MKKVVYNAIKHIPGVEAILYFTGNTPYIQARLCTQQLGDIMNSPYRDILDKYQNCHPKDVLTVRQAMKLIKNLESSTKK